MAASRAHGDFLNALSIVLFYWGRQEKVVEMLFDYIRNVMCQAVMENTAEVITGRSTQ